MKVKDKINEVINKSIVKPNSNQNLVNSKINSRKTKIEQLESGEKEELKQQYLKNNENDD